MTTRERFEMLRKSGYPNYEKDNYSASYELKKVRSALSYSYFDGTRFSKYQSANGFLFSYFPHWIDVKCGKSASISESWNDDKKLVELIEKTEAFCEKHNEQWSTNRLRQNAKVYLAKQSVSNFNPVTARILYDMFAPEGIVYDMSMGWGGRLLGFHASSANIYIGCEPSTKTYKGLNELNGNLTEITHKETHLLMCGSEKADLSEWNGKIDFCFTSPPYFDTEKYSEEETQSYIAYPTLNEWLNKFLKATMQICYNALRGKGVMAINYADTPNVTLPMIEFAKQIGFTLEDTLQYEISSISGKGRKYEPIFIFRKGGKGVELTTKQDTLF